MAGGVGNVGLGVPGIDWFILVGVCGLVRFFGCTEEG